MQEESCLSDILSTLALVEQFALGYDEKQPSKVFDSLRCSNL
jgi:hypothetical protein